MLLTVDSSVLVASIIEQEKYHEQCKSLMTKISNAEHIVVVPYSVLVEFAASLNRRTGSKTIAENSERDVKEMEAIFFLELTEERALEAAYIAKETGLKGMDAIVVQVAKENGSKLITLDDEMVKRSENIADVIHIDRFEDSNNIKNED